MSSISSWAKVASGARLVLGAVAKQTADEAGVVAQRASAHGLDLGARAAATTSNLAQDGFRTNYYNNSSFQQDHDGSSTPQRPNPYESQLRKQQQQQQRKESDKEPIHQNLSKPKTTDTTTNDSNDKIIPNPYLLHAQQIDETAPTQAATASATTSGLEEAKEKKSVHQKGEEDEPSSSSLSSSVDSTNAILSNGSEAATTTTDQIHPLIGPATTTEQQQKEARRWMKEGKAVPSSRIGRAAGFASLGFGLAVGTASSWASRFLGSSSSSSSSAVASDANADRLAATLCRMRGAALKMGQMLSIQDESLLPPALTRALQQVRQGADAMPNHQLVQQMKSQLGPDWKEKFVSFEELPFAAASIGQVHRATIYNYKEEQQDVVVKVQYPGVARSIESDLRNLSMLVTMTGLAPKGLFIENVLRVGRDELKVECNYINEMANQRAFQTLVSSDPILVQNKFRVPTVIDELTTEQVIVSEFAPGGTIDKVSGMDQEERNRIGRTILYLTMKELFDWRLMQTDPNWGNFLYDVNTKVTTLIDFGAAREYDKQFVDGYLRIVWANANQDEETLMEQSRRMNFLTGDENAEMLNAHKWSGFTVGEPFWKDEPFDFKASRISTRMSPGPAPQRFRLHLTPFSLFCFLYVISPPPEEVYTLHRKLAGAYMLCIKLGAVVKCRDMLEDVVANHVFEDGLPHPMHGDTAQQETIKQ
eukprot:scaffold1376_cov125-Cylindrotheca_fusiformis.AAC.5